MGQRTDELLAQAREHSPLVAQRGTETVLAAKASGCRVFDADNVAYIDLLGAGGTNLLGYANQYVLDAVRKASATGLATGFPAVHEIELVEQLEPLLPEMSPWVLTSSETEAWELALRWCRRRSGRQRILVFEGNRRGAVESFAVSSVGPRGISQASVAGVPAEATRLIRVVPWGDIEATRAVIAEAGVDIAAIVVDPLALGAGVWRPDPGFLRVVRDLADESGAFLVVDETVTGLRVARGGATELFDLSPDVAVFGGALGGGVVRMGAVSWAERLKASPGDDLPPSPPPVAVLAASATISVLRNDAVHQRLEERGAQLQQGVEALAERFERPLLCRRVGSVFWCTLTKKPITSPQAAQSVDGALWARFAAAVREQGVLLPARQVSPCFLSHAHGVKDIEQVLQAMEAALKRMQKEDEA